MFDRRLLFQLLIALALLGGASACSINRLAVRALSDVLSSEEGAAGAFAQDNDPELVAQALPFTLKLYDTLLEQDPDNPALLRAAGSAYISYANAFLQIPASMLPPQEYERRENKIRRAKNLYLRGRGMVLRALDLRYPGIEAAVRATQGDALEVALAEVKVEHIAYLYWTAAGWMGALATDPLDLRLAMSIGQAAALMQRAYELQPEWDNGAIHEFYISYYATVPEGMGGDRGKAREHFAHALQISGGVKAGPYVELALGVALPQQDLDEFISLMQQALEVDIDAAPQYLLVNTIKQRQARWYLENLERFFLIGIDDNEESDL